MVAHGGAGGARTVGPRKWRPIRSRCARALAPAGVAGSSPSPAGVAGASDGRAWLGEEGGRRAQVASELPAANPAASHCLSVASLSCFLIILRLRLCRWPPSRMDAWMLGSKLGNSNAVWMGLMFRRREVGDVIGFCWAISGRSLQSLLGRACGNLEASSGHRRAILGALGGICG